MKTKDYAAICRECARLDSCIMEYAKCNKTMMYCSDFKKSEKLSENYVCQNDLNKMIIATNYIETSVREIIEQAGKDYVKQKIGNEVE